MIARCRRTPLCVTDEHCERDAVSSASRGIRNCRAANAIPEADPGGPVVLAAHCGFLVDGVEISVGA